MANPQTRPVLVITGAAEPIAIELERDDFTRGQRLQTAQLGEVRQVFVMQPPGEDGIYNQVADRYLLDPVQVDPNFAGVAALKVVKHSLGVVPAETEVLRADPLYHRENPALETEMMALIASSPNPDPQTCLYTWPTDPSPIVPAPIYTGHQGIMWMLGLFGDIRNMYVLMPFIRGGDLFDTLRAAPGNRATDADAIGCMQQVTSAVHFLHALGIAHQSITTENVMLHTLTNRPVGPALRFVLIDFGQAVWHADVGGAVQLLPPRPIATAPGKVCYYCPDTYLYSAGPYSGLRIDCWQLGVLVIYLTTGSQPFRFIDGVLQPGTPYNRSLYQWFERAHQALSAIPVLSPAGASIPLHTAVTAPCMDFFQQTIVIDSLQRMTIDAIRAHPWLTSGADRVESNELKNLLEETLDSLQTPVQFGHICRLIKEKTRRGDADGLDDLLFGFGARLGLTTRQIRAVLAERSDADVDRVSLLAAYQAIPAFPGSTGVVQTLQEMEKLRREDAFYRAIACSKLEWRRSRLMIVGQGAAGITKMQCT